MVMRITDEILKPLFDRINGCDWASESQRLLGLLKSYATRAGRFAARPLLQLWFVMTDKDTSMRDKALLYAALLYVVLPGDLLPRRVLKLLGIVDDLGAVMFMVSKVRNLITPAITVRVEQILDDWFGMRCEVVDD